VGRRGEISSFKLFLLAFPFVEKGGGAGVSTLSAVLIEKFFIFNFFVNIVFFSVPRREPSC
jgi:hypothetical protein